MSIHSCRQARDKFSDTIDWYMPTGLDHTCYRERMHGSSSSENLSSTNRCSPSTLDHLLDTVHCCRDTSIVSREHIHHVHYRRQCRWNKRSPVCTPGSVNGIDRSSEWDFGTWQNTRTHSLHRSCSMTRIAWLAKKTRNPRGDVISMTYSSRSSIAMLLVGYCADDIRPRRLRTLHIVD